MLELKKIELSDKQWIDPLLKLSDFRGCEYNFTNNFVWSGVYNITVGRFQDFYVSKHGNCFVFPAGKVIRTHCFQNLKITVTVQEYRLNSAVWI